MAIWCDCCPHWWCRWNFSLTSPFRTHYGPGVDSASNRNEYQEYFLADKGGRCVGLTTLPPSCADFLESGSLNLLKPSGSVQACNGIANFTVLGVGRVTELWAPWPRNRGSILSEVLQSAQPSLRRTQPHMLRVPGVKRSVPEADSSRPSSGELIMRGIQPALPYVLWWFAQGRAFFNFCRTPG
jgi:hypothetical protein